MIYDNSHIYIYIYIYIYWLVVWNMFYDFPFSWECHHPNWRTHIFQRLKPPTSIYIYIHIYIYTSWQIYPIIQLQLGENGKNQDTADTASFRSVALCQAAGICDDLEECTHFSITVTWREQLQKQPVFCHIFLAKKLSLNSARWIDLTLFNQAKWGFKNLSNHNKWILYIKHHKTTLLQCHWSDGECRG